MNIAWVIVVFLFIFLAQGLINKKWGLKGIAYHRYFKQSSVFEGEKVVMVYEIMNRKILPVAWLRLETMIHSNLLNEDMVKIEEEGPVYHSTLFSLRPYQKITRRHHFIGRKRGYYPLQNVSVTVGDPMGFHEVFDSITAQTAVTVYPKLMPMEEIPLPSHSWLGEITVKRSRIHFYMQECVNINKVIHFTPLTGRQQPEHILFKLIRKIIRLTIICLFM
jgi:uncharacterized protein (DUF58 family)